MEKLRVNGSNNKYDICFSDSFDGLKDAITSAIDVSGKKAIIITDSNVRELYLKEVEGIAVECFDYVSSYVIDAGEQSKTLKSAENIIKTMIENGFRRDDIIIALGGGVTGDLSGFCASVYMRGIGFIQIPTTLLSQIDSSIGGKVAVDMDSYKNMVGAFHDPVLVYENSSVLSSLPEEQFISGMAEVIKSALLGDKALWEYLQDNIKSGNISEISSNILIHILYNTCLIKKNIVEEDPFDNGKRALLNLGHTIGHAIEKCASFRLSHGFCVALGTVCCAYMSSRRGYISKETYGSIYSYINLLRLPVKLPEDIRLDKMLVLDAISKDKKNSAKGLNFIFIDSPGKAVIRNDVTAKEIIDSLDIIGID